ncbi:hypothetical protein HPP92_019520 [Vanilla planifolia]|uniref:Uncharacterized protein n=1 Tax=Vanilla planifolia TaxID=51239 RepID=A0A835UL73_VANPL|nr:hypothetical protein HPP92_019520 [Vanilla planifolia]
METAAQKALETRLAATGGYRLSDRSLTTILLNRGQNPHRRGHHAGKRISITERTKTKEKAKIKDTLMKRTHQPTSVLRSRTIKKSLLQNVHSHPASSKKAVRSSVVVTSAIDLGYGGRKKDEWGVH